METKSEKNPEQWCLKLMCVGSEYKKNIRKATDSKERYLKIPQDPRFFQHTV